MTTGMAAWSAADTGHSRRTLRWSGRAVPLNAGTCRRSSSGRPPSPG